MATLSCPLVGMHFHPPAKAVLAFLPAATPLTLVPEPDNPHDALAIQVHCKPTAVPEPLRGELELHLQGYGLKLAAWLESESCFLGYIAKTLPKALKEEPEGWTFNEEVHSLGPVEALSASLGFTASGAPMVLVTKPGDDA